MMSSPRATRRHADGPVAAAVAAAAGSVEIAGDGLVVRLPDPRLLLLVARSVLLAAALALLSVPSLRAALLPAPDGPASPPRSRWVDEPFELPMLLRDLGRNGLLSSGDRRAIFLGDARSRLPLLRRLKMEPVSPEQEPAVLDRSVDFVLATNSLEDASFLFVERVLSVGGVAAFRLSSDPSSSFHLPPNFRIVYIRRFRSTIVAIKKTAHTASNAAGFPQSRTSRRLLSVPEAKKAALNALEDVLLEPPNTELRTAMGFLPDLTGDSLGGHACKVFVNIGPPTKQYPKRGLEFEVTWLNVAAGVKAETEVVEEMVKGKAIGLAEEHGKLTGEGGGVHQWWWGRGK